jgi:hypothetical protein
MLSQIWYFILCNLKGLFHDYVTSPLWSRCPVPVSFLSLAAPCGEDLSRYFHLDDADREAIMQKRGDHNRLGFALQLTTVRFLGTFLEEPTAVPLAVVQFVARQINVDDTDCLLTYAENRQRWMHTVEIRTRYNYREFIDPIANFRLKRWLYALCWTGTERPSELFARATAWMLVHKVLLPGYSALERLVAQLRSRIEARLWRLLGRDISAEQRQRLEHLLSVPEGSRR